MNFLLAIKFDWSLIFGFLAGIFAAIVIMALLYLFFALKSFKKYQVKDLDKKIIEKNTLERIYNTKAAFEVAKTNQNEAINLTIDLCNKLVYDTAKDFFPRSKYPIFELSIDEVLLLATYINKRVDEVLEHRLFKPVRALKISTILSLKETKEKIEANEIVTKTKKYKIMSALNATKKVINLVNPLWWAKNIVVDKAITIILNKLCLIIIDIVGEETYRIYSKHVFNDDSSLSEITDDIENIEKEIENEEEKH